jgi:hypothetical protein
VRGLKSVNGSRTLTNVLKNAPLILEKQKNLNLNKVCGSNKDLSECGKA